MEHPSSEMSLLIKLSSEQIDAAVGVEFALLRSACAVNLRNRVSDHLIGRALHPGLNPTLAGPLGRFLFERIMAPNQDGGAMAARLQPLAGEHKELFCHQFRASFHKGHKVYCGGVGEDDAHTAHVADDAGTIRENPIRSQLEPRFTVLKTFRLEGFEDVDNAHLPPHRQG